MPQTGTLAALKELFKARRTVTGAGPFNLTPADIGLTIMVNNVGPGPFIVNLPVIPGIPPTLPTANDGVSRMGNGAAICIVAAGAGPGQVDITFPVPVRPVGAVADTFNAGQAGPVSLTAQNQWAIFVSDGALTNPGDWLVIRGG